MPGLRAVFTTFLGSALLPLAAGSFAYQGDWFACVAKWEKSWRAYAEDKYCLLEMSKVRTLMANIEGAEATEAAPPELRLGAPSQCIDAQSGMFNVCTELKGKNPDRVSWSSKKNLHAGCFRDSDEEGTADAEEVMELCVGPEDCNAGNLCGTQAAEAAGGETGDELDDRDLDTVIHTGDEMLCVRKVYRSGWTSKTRRCLLKKDVARSVLQGGGKSFFIADPPYCQKTEQGTNTGKFRACTDVHEDGSLVWSSKIHMAEECFEEEGGTVKANSGRLFKTLIMGSWQKCAKYNSGEEENAVLAV